MAPLATGCPVDHSFDPLSAAYLRDPAAVLSTIAVDAQPVFFAPSIDMYVVTRYADIEAVFLDPDSYSAAAAQLPIVPLVPEAQKILLDGGHRPQPSMVSLDRPAHTRLREPTARALTPRRVAEMEPRIRAIAASLLGGIAAGEPFDLVEALTFPLPASVVFSFMGVPEEDWPKLRAWSGSRASLAWGRPTPEEQVEHARNMALYRRYLRELVAAKTHTRGDDFASALLEIHDEDPDGLVHEEIASILFSLSFAGHETTNNLIGNTVRLLLEDRSRWERLLADPGLIGGAIDEVLRFDPSVVVWRRLTTRPVALGGVDIPAGAKLFLWLFAAGRDASVFPDPDVFDPERPNARRTLAFGRGIHFCVGSALARLEATVAVEELQRRLPTLEAVAESDVPYHPNISFRGPQHLWVRAA